MEEEIFEVENKLPYLKKEECREGVEFLVTDFGIKQDGKFGKEIELTINIDGKEKKLSLWLEQVKPYLKRIGVSIYGTIKFKKSMFVNKIFYIESLPVVKADGNPSLGWNNLEFLKDFATVERVV